MIGILSMYVKCKEVECVYKMFDRMFERDVFFWNVIMVGYV